MKTIYFITGNKGKFREAKIIIPNLEQLVIDLPEIQELDPHAIIQAKLEQRPSNITANLLSRIHLFVANAWADCLAH